MSDAPSSTTGSDASWLQRSAPARGASRVLGLCIAWSLREPERIGESAHLTGAGTSFVLGRGSGDGEAPRVQFARRRPGQSRLTAPLRAPAISREQLRIRVEEERLWVESVGRCPMRIHGTATTSGHLAPGDTLLLEDQLLLVCTLSPSELGAEATTNDHAFGTADAHGIVGESHVAHALRERIATLAKASKHILITGESGTGKELAAQAVHRLSARRDGPLVSRNAATFPSGLIDAELFGSIRDYPNAGMPARPGLVGEADGGTLFLDEVGELPHALQTHLLRVLDAGEYQRLGAAKSSRASFRLIGATSRAPDSLIPELLARLTVRLELPTLDDRREDIPLIARELLCRAARDDADLAERLFDAWDGSFGQPRIHPELMDALVRHHYTTHVRELDGLLWEALASSRGDYIEPSNALRSTLSIRAPAEDAAPKELDAEDVRRALAAHDGSVTEAARALGLSSRFVLYRLMRRLGIDAETFRSDG